MIIDQTDDRLASRGTEAADTFPCTMLQERLWTRHKVEGPHGLNVAMRWLVNGCLTRTAVEGALQSLVRRHEILRTSFREVAGRLVQVVRPAGPLKILDVDLSFLSADESAARAEEMAKAEAIEPMDPLRGPLLRATLLRFGPNRSVLLLTFHSMVADGWSIGLLISEFHAAARAIDSGILPDASDPELQFADYALYEKELLASDALDDARAFWRRLLVDAVGTQVPPDRLPELRRDEQSLIASILLPDALSRVSDGFARQHDVTLYSLAAGALALMLHRVTGDPEIVFGSQVANRAEPAAEGLIGPTVNSITLRLTVDADAERQRFVRSVAEAIREALQHQRLPFEIAEGFAPVHAGRPLHAINLVVHRSYSGTAETERQDPGRFSLLSLPSYSSGTAWDLNFYLIGRDEGWRMSCEARADLYDAETVRGLVDAWRQCLDALVSSADGSLADTPALHAIAARAPARVRHPARPWTGAQTPATDPARQIVRFNESGSSTPMVVLNNRSVYYHLARQLGQDRPFTDIQLFDPSSPFEEQPKSFEDFAGDAIRLIRWAQPRGPYILGGHCVYGVLAFEAARQLQAEGETIELVALFDSWAPGYRETMSPRDQRLRQLQLRMRERVKRLGQYNKGEVGLNEIVRKPILRRLGLLGPDPPPERTPDLRFDDLVSESVKAYRPVPYTGDVVLFRSQETLRGRLFDEQMGWRPLVSGNLVKVEVDSFHQDMFREQPAGDIAAVLRASLAKREGN